MTFGEFSYLDAKYLHDTATIISETQQYKLEQTDIWLKNNLLPTLFNTAKKGEFEWEGRIIGVYKKDKYGLKIEGLEAPSCGLDMQRVKIQLEKLGFTIWNLTADLITIRW